MSDAPDSVNETDTANTLARPHKRVATLIGAGIAAMLSPSGKIISSAAAASLIIAAASQVYDAGKSKTVEMETPRAEPAMTLPVSHVAIETASGKTIPVMMTEYASDELPLEPAEVGGTFQSGIPVAGMSAPTGSSAAAPSLSPLASAPPPSSWLPPPPDAPLPAPKEPLPPEIITELPPPIEPDEPPAETGGPEDPDPKNPPEKKLGNPPEGEEPPPPAIENGVPQRINPAAHEAPGGLPQGSAPQTLATPGIAAVAVTEPGILGLSLLGLAGLAWTTHRRR